MPDNADDEHTPTPGIDSVVTRAELDKIDIDKSLAELKSVDCHDVNRQLHDLITERPEERSAALRLLEGLTSYHFVPDHQTEPFQPQFVMGGRRSLVPTDLQEEQINVLAEFAPTVDHLGLRARLSDVSWFMQRRRHDMAEMAIAAYCDSVEAVRAGHAVFSFENASAWGVGAKDALVRSARISHVTGWKLPASKRVKTLLADLIATAYRDGRSDDFWRIADVDLDYRITPPAELATMAEELAGGEPLAKNFEARLELLEIAARAYRRADDEQNANRCMVEAAECHVQKANLTDSHMLEAHFLQRAIQVLRNYPNTQERRKALTARLRKTQPGIRDEMGHISTEIDLTEIVEHSVASVRGHSWPIAFLSLVLCNQPPTPEEIQEAALKHAREHPLQAHMPMQVHDFQGRVVFSSPGMTGDGGADGEHLRYLMAFNRSLSRQVTAAGAINPIRRTIASEHPVSDATIIELLRESPFIPSGHEYIYARAICHFLGGQDIEAVSLLTPQLENSLRHILALNGHDTTIADANGIQTEASLSILLKPDRPWRVLLEESLPARYIHEIDLLFDFAGGPSIRNQVAHGKVPAGGFWQHDFTYAAWLIIHLAVVPLARRWGDVEEIFARVTGLRRVPGPDQLE